MKINLVIIFLIMSVCLFGQNKHISFGINGNGICFGNSSNYNGIRFNLQDRLTNKINGLNVSGYSGSNHLNGISVGLLTSIDSFSNGLKIGVFSTKAKRHNGLAFGCLGLSGTKINGVGLSGLVVYADTLNGFFVATFGLIPFYRSRAIKVINGVAVGGGVIASAMNGVSIAYFSNIFDKQVGISIAAINLTKELHGFQFGILNCALNNKRFFRWTPILNFNLRKKIK